MVQFKSFQGTVRIIDDFPVGQNEGCYQLMAVEDEHGSTVQFVVSPTTYFVNHMMIKVGDHVTGYYDANAAVPLIFPPQYQAIVIAKDNPYQNVKVDYFNEQLKSSDGQLQLNLSPYTEIVLTNGQAFTKSPRNRDLVVIYGPSTKSIPAQTTPYKIIVLC